MGPSDPLGKMDSPGAGHLIVLVKCSLTRWNSMLDYVSTASFSS